MLFVIFLGIFLFSGFKLYKEWRRYHDAAQRYDRISENAKVPVTEQETRQTISEIDQETESASGEGTSPAQAMLPKPKKPEYDIDFDYMTSINPDVIGWITIPNTRVDYPIAQGEDNDYYLHYSLEGDLDWVGCPFVDYRQAGDFSGRITYIYGHDLNDGAMFPDIKKYRDQSYYETNPYFYIFTADRTLVYQVFSSHTMAKDDGVSFRLGFSDDEDFLEYVDHLKDIAYYDTGLEITSEDRFVSLVTCEEDRNYRFVVNGVLIQEIQESH